MFRQSDAHRGLARPMGGAQGVGKVPPSATLASSASSLLKDILSPADFITITNERDASGKAKPRTTQYKVHPQLAEIDRHLPAYHQLITVRERAEVTALKKAQTALSKAKVEASGVVEAERVATEAQAKLQDLYDKAFSIIDRMRITIFEWHRFHPMGPLTGTVGDPEDTRILSGLLYLLENLEKEHTRLVNMVIRKDMELWVPDHTLYDIPTLSEEDSGVEDTQRLWRKLTSETFPVKVVADADGEQPISLPMARLARRQVPSGAVEFLKDELEMTDSIYSSMAWMMRTVRGREVLREMTGLTMSGEQIKEVAPDKRRAPIRLHATHAYGDKRYGLNYPPSAINKALSGKSQGQNFTELNFPGKFGHSTFLGKKIPEGGLEGTFLTIYPPFLHLANALSSAGMARAGRHMRSAQQIRNLSEVENPMRSEVRLPRRSTTWLMPWKTYGYLPAEFSPAELMIPGEENGEVYSEDIEAGVEKPKEGSFPVTFSVPKENAKRRFRMAGRKVIWRNRIVKGIEDSAPGAAGFDSVYDATVASVLSKKAQASAPDTDTSPVGTLKMYWLDLLSRSEGYDPKVDETIPPIPSIIQSSDRKSLRTDMIRSAGGDRYHIMDLYIQTDSPELIWCMLQLQRVLTGMPPETVDKVGAKMNKESKMFELFAGESKDIGEAVTEEVFHNLVGELAGMVGAVLEGLIETVELFKGAVEDVRLLMDEDPEKDPEVFAKRAVERGAQLARVAKSVLSLTKTIMGLVGKAPLAVTSAVPALGIVISAVEVARSGYSLSQDVMNYLAMLDRVRQLRVKGAADPLMEQTLDEDGDLDESVLYQVAHDKAFRQKVVSERLNLFTGSYSEEGLRDVRELDLAEELKDMNRDRMVDKSVRIAAEIIRIAGGIVVLTGVSAPAGLGLNIGASALEGGLYLMRFGAQKVRDLGWGPPEETTKGLHRHRLEMIKQIFGMIVRFKGKDDRQAKLIKAYVKATGSSVKELCAEKSNDGRIRALYKAMKDED
ncbi:hypothetical protein FUAX_34500 [Fulvitalea axinellae]|uniref:Uncharacterized protein n=1 Tax=Fulvitalea axinellae TaxID=1182444 RepID=A0AAU9D4V3_9BACT|nr:hypothetical protein FUAX_34500 [Fulvitalea axinellae]